MVSPIGAGVGPFWDALADGRTGAGRVEMEGVGTINAFPVLEGEDARERFGQRDARRMDRSGRLAAVAGAMALEDAGDLGLDSERVGISLGSVHGGAETLLEAHRAFLERGADRVGPLAIPLSLANHPCAAAARALGLRGPSAAPATACAAGSDAIGFALSVLRDGRAEAMVGGRRRRAPVPARHRGLHQGGRAQHRHPPARAGLATLRPGPRRLRHGRGRRACCCSRSASTRWPAGRASTPRSPATAARATPATRPTPTRPARARPARCGSPSRTPGSTAADIGYVNAHATSTIAGDIAEAHAITLAGLGETAISSTKSAHGHALGGAGGVEAVATLMAFARDTLPATLNLEVPDPEAPFDHVLEPRPATIGAAMSNSFGFGGHNACLVLTRHEG